MPAANRNSSRVIQGNIPDDSANPESLFKSQQELDADEPEDIALLNVIADLGGSGGDAVVNIYRAGANRSMSFLFTCSPDEFNLEKLRDEYGGGQYRIHVREKGLLKANKLISIEAPRPKATPQGTQANDSTVIALAAAMQQGFEKLGQMIIQTAQMNQRPAIDPDEQENKFLNRMLIMKQIFDKPGNDNSANQFDMFTKGMELMKEISSEKQPGESSSMDVLLETVKSFAPVIAGAALQRPPMAPVAARPVVPPQHVGAMAHPAAVPTVTPQIQPETVTMNQQDIEQNAPEIVQFVHFLTMQAKANKDPVLYADLVLDQIDTGEALAMVNHPTALDDLCRMVPEAANYRNWFAQLLEAIKSALVEMGYTVGTTNSPESPDAPISHLGEPTANS